MTEQTEHKPNRLIYEKSPYLLQHAYNPVDWYPWSPEAFEKAQKEDKPIFLSVGYSTCHWCHVMEKESFENSEIARMMNEYFVSIKVDREERPDIDQIYMQAVQRMTGSGGWPMSVFITPDQKPFYGGTYFPPEDRWGHPGFSTVLKRIHEHWTSNRAHLLELGQSMTAELSKSALQTPPESHVLSEETLRQSFEYFLRTFDRNLGGFGQAPKFPRSHVLSLLLRYYKRTQNAEALTVVEKTLHEMERGGMYDHLGGGFHRYSTDQKWHVPHFEKMLYDQALLVKTYLEAYQATGKEAYGAVARDILRYVLRDMRHEGGAFYSAEDADSAVDALQPEQKSEGAFYIWSLNEIQNILGAEDAGIFAHAHGVLPEGNAENDPHGEFTGRNILYRAHTLAETAKHFKKEESEIKKILDHAVERLFNERLKRPRPHLDDKILTDWNGLMISALASAASVLDEPAYADAARRGADFILEKMKTPSGRLMHRWRDGETAVSGFIEDYAFLAWGLFDLYEATFEPRYLKEAVFLTRETVRLFWDEKNGGFFFSGKDAETLIAPSKELYDGAIPSGNSVAALNLLRVGRLTMDAQLETLTGQMMDGFSGALSEFPAGYPQMLIALDFMLGPVREITFAGDPNDKKIKEMMRFLKSLFIPNKVVTLHPPAGPEKNGEIEALIPFTRKQTMIDGKATVYVCKNYACDLPVYDVENLEKLLRS
ncbi:MAG: thioredoxin domain-containing protein [Candidatus Omnitrophica bacterium]|nr:thioredoxin domain-containing protein [Candidatus Omnitrophota bacterium]